MIGSPYGGLYFLTACLFARIIPKVVSYIHREIGETRSAMVYKPDSCLSLL